MISYFCSKFSTQKRIVWHLLKMFCCFFQLRHIHDVYYHLDNFRCIYSLGFDQVQEQLLCFAISLQRKLKIYHQKVQFWEDLKFSFKKTKINGPQKIEKRISRDISDLSNFIDSRSAYKDRHLHSGDMLYICVRPLSWKISSSIKALISYLC